MRCMICKAESDRGFCPAHRDPELDKPIERTQSQTGPALEICIPNHACKADALTRGMPVAHSVRRDRSGTVVSDGGMKYRVTADGRKTTLGGLAIIDSKDQRERHKARWGLTEAE